MPVKRSVTHGFEPSVGPAPVDTEDDKRRQEEERKKSEVFSVLYVQGLFDSNRASHLGQSIVR